jgi:hypothetical protein
MALKGPKKSWALQKVKILCQEKGCLVFYLVFILLHQQQLQAELWVQVAGAAQGDAVHQGVGGGHQEEGSHL